MAATGPKDDGDSKANSREVPPWLSLLQAEPVDESAVPLSLSLCMSLSLSLSLSFELDEEAEEQEEARSTTGIGNNKECPVDTVFPAESELDREGARDVIRPWESREGKDERTWMKVDCLEEDFGKEG